MKITSTHKLFDTILLLLLVFSSGGLLFVFHRNLFSVVLFSISLFSLFFLGERVKKSIFNTSLLTLVLFYFFILINYIYCLGDQSYIKYGFHLLNICRGMILHNCASKFIITSKYKDETLFMVKTRVVSNLLQTFTIHS